MLVQGLSCFTGIGDDMVHSFYNGVFLKLLNGSMLAEELDCFSSDGIDTVHNFYKWSFEKY